MKYYSTSMPDIKVSMHEAVTSCIPQTGGLYMPEALPRVPGAFIHNTSDMSLREIAYAMTNVFMGSDISSATIKKVIDDALSFETPIVKLSDGLYVLELFHGPTKVFKDIGSRFLAGFFNSLNPHDGTKLNVLVTTTGNTGMAVAKAFAGKADINVFILFPHGAVSRVDVPKMKSAGPNIHTLEIGGTIDDCRAIVASTFSDKSLRENVLITTANSTNFARLMPQVALFFYGVGHLANEGLKPADIDIAVPSGNLGMLTSGLMAKRIGLQCNKLIAACNANNAFVSYIKTGKYAPAATVTTYARLMDMSSPSNLPRLMALSNGSLESLRADIVSATITDSQIADTIRTVYENTGYVADSHTAVAIASLESRSDKAKPALIMATAHPSKSAALMNDILGSDYDSPRQSQAAVSQLSRPDRLPPTYPAFKKYLLSHQ